MRLVALPADPGGVDAVAGPPLGSIQRRHQQVDDPVAGRIRAPRDDVDAQGQALLGFEQGRGGAFLYDDLEL